MRPRPRSKRPSRDGALRHERSRRFPVGISGDSTCARIIVSAAVIKIILQHKYFNAAQVVSRFGIIGATLIWSLIVLWKGNALATTALGPSITPYIHEDVLAMILLTCAGVALYQLLRQCIPHRIWTALYAIMLAFWLLLWSYVLLSAAPIRPAVFAALSLVVAYGIAAFISNPRREP